MADVDTPEDLRALYERNKKTAFVLSRHGVYAKHVTNFSRYPRIVRIIVRLFDRHTCPE